MSGMRWGALSEQQGRERLVIKTNLFGKFFILL
jgi:hypothetical protein